MTHPARTHKVWIEIHAPALSANVATMRSRIQPTTKLLAVVKSNAYGHGIYAVAPLLARIGVDGFCVDSIIEASRLRESGITQPILVIGPTLPSLYDTAATHAITLSIGSIHELDQLISWQQQSEKKVSVHIKVDTGMHRRGFALSDLAHVFDRSKAAALAVTGIYSHFAASKDSDHLEHNAKQQAVFDEAVAIAAGAGYTSLLKHLGATSSTLIDPRYEYDAVRIGIGLYGVFPSEKLESRYSATTTLTPILSMRAVISEIKAVAAGEGIGYDFTETLGRETRVAIVPIGYWHGIPRALSSRATFLVAGKRAKILGLVSMDMVAIDVTDIDCQPGDTVTCIGNDGAEKNTARQLGLLAGTTPHEILVRLNPLIERSVVY